MLCAPCASGQSFKDGLKQLGKRLGKQVEQKVEQKVVEEATKQVEKQVDKAFDSMTGKQSVGKNGRRSRLRNPQPGSPLATDSWSSSMRRCSAPMQARMTEIRRLRA